MSDGDRLEQVEARMARLEASLDRLTRRIDEVENVWRAPEEGAEEPTGDEMERVGAIAHPPETAEPVASTGVSPVSDLDFVAPNRPVTDQPTVSADATVDDVEAVAPASAEPERPEPARAVFDETVETQHSEAAPPPPPYRALKPSGPPPPSVLRTLLKRLHLLPPKPGESAEAEIVAWWATRIGALLGALAVVFFGVYVSRNTPAWVRFSELAGISVGVAVLGLWLERRVREFGAVVFGLGLALIYFTMFAAFSIEPVRVLYDPALASALQYAAVVLIAGCALWRDSERIALMATLLGFVTCGFSLFQDMYTFALSAGLLLSVVASILLVARGWRGPFMAAVPLVYVVYGVISMGYWVARHRAPLPFPVCMGWLTVTHVALAAGDYVAERRGRGLAVGWRRLGMPFSSTAAALLAFLTAETLYNDRLATMYFFFGALFLAACVVWYVRRRGDMMVQAYFLKASALVSLGMIEVLDDRTQWIALGVQSAVLVVAARRWRFPVARPLVLVTWLASLGFLFYDTSRRAAQPDLFSPTGILELGYFALSSAVLAAYHKWTPVPLERATSCLGSGVSVVSGLAANVCMAILGVSAVRLTSSLVLESHWPATMILVSIALLAGLAAFRTVPALLSPGIALLAAHLTCWGLEPRQLVLSSATVWWQMLAVVVFTMAASVGAYLAKRRFEEHAVTVAHVSAWALHLLWMFTFLEALGEIYLAPVGVFAAAALTLAVGLVAAWQPMRVLPYVAGFPLVLLPFASACALAYGRPLLAVGGPLWEWAALAIAAVFVVVTRAWTPLRRRYLPDADDRFVPPSEWLHAAVLMIPAFYAFGNVASPDWRMLVWMAAGLAALGMLLWPRLRTACFAAAVCIAMAHGVFHIRVAEMAGVRYFLRMLDVPLSHGRISGPDIFTWGQIGASLALAAATVGAALWLRRLPWPWSRGLRRQFEWIYAVAGLGAAFTAFAIPTGPAPAYTTAFWVVSSVVVLVSGFVLGVKPVRIVALAGLAVCIPRAFLVDITATLHRIVAFMVLSAVLLAVGYLYTRYGHLIRQFDEQDGGDASGGEK